MNNCLQNHWYHYNAADIIGEIRALQGTVECPQWELLMSHGPAITSLITTLIQSELN